MDELSQSVLDLIDIDELEATIVSPEMVNQIKTEVIEAIDMNSLSQAVLDTIDIEALRDSILASIAANADTLDGFDSSYFATRNNPTFMGVITTGGQLKFPATAVSSADSNTLDDYEEGTFIPSFTSTGSTTFTHSEQNGTYTKIGRQVTISIQITITKRNGTNSNAVVISGLPFKSTSLSQYGFSGQFGLHKSTKDVTAVINQNSNVITLYDRSTSTALTAASLSNGTYTLTMTYFTN